MKHLSRILLAVSATFLFSCSNSEKMDKNTFVVTEKIQYPVFIKSPYPEEESDWWVENIEGKNREKFVNLLLDAAFEGKIPVYDYLVNTKLSKQQIDNIKSKKDTLTIISTSPPFDDRDTVVVTELDRKKIHRLTFLEEWSFNEKEFSMQKRIIGIAPAETVYADSTEIKGFKPLFWIYLDGKVPESK